MKRFRRPSTAVNALLALMIVGAGVWGWTLLRDPEETSGANASGIRTVTATQGTVTRTVSAAGAVASAATATATFATAGTVTAIGVKVGQQVAAGALLARVDDADARRDLALAGANLAAAKDALSRAEAAGTDTGNASHAVTGAQLAVDEAEAAVAGTRLIAPMAGTVVAVNGTLGGPSGAGQDAATGPGPGTASGAGRPATGGFVDLADLKKLQITAAFPEAEATELKAGQSATIVWNALQNAETTGEVVAVDPTATSGAGAAGTGDGTAGGAAGAATYGVTVSLPNPPDGARPGQTVTVAVVTGSVENAVMVNPAAITTTGSRRSVTVLDGAGRQEVRPVQIGLEGDDAYQITSGLAVGERALLPAGDDTAATTTVRGGGGTPPGDVSGGGTGGR